MIEKLNNFIEKELFEEEEERFRVTDDNQADWAVRKIAEKENEIESVKEFAEQQIEQIKRWMKTEVEPLENDIDFLKSLLHEFLRTTERKRIKLPSGYVGFRKQQPKWEYDDETIIKSLEESDLTEFVRIKKEINKSELKKNVEIKNGKAVNKDTGEIIDGITVTEREERLNVRIDT